MSDSLRPHGLQLTRSPCPSLSPGVCSDSCRLNWWGYLTILYSAALFSFCPQSFFPRIKVFSNESVLCIRWPKYWSFSFSISPPSEYSGLISFRIDWFDLLAVQVTLKSLQHHNSKASVLQHSAFFMVYHICTWLLEKPQLWLYGPLPAKWCLCFFFFFFKCYFILFFCFLIYCLGLS